MTLLNTLGEAQLPIAIHSGEGPLLWELGFYGGHAVTLIGNSHPNWLRPSVRKQTVVFLYDDC